MIGRATGTTLVLAALAWTAVSCRVVAERLIAGGEAIARQPDGRVVFVGGALPGEDVTVTISEAKRDWARGTVAELHSRSPHRVEPPCRRRLQGCGGCDWQHLAVAEQLPAKAGIVVDALRRTARLADPQVRAGGAVPSTGYRTTIRVIGDDGEHASYRRERSHDTVHATGCLIAHPALTAALDDVRIPTGVELSLRVSAATGEMTALWDTARGEVIGLPPRTRTGPNASLVEVVAGHDLRVSAASFFQSGPQAAGLLVDAVARAAPELETAEHVVDAYGGVGLFAVAAVPRRCRVTLIESSRIAVADAVHNLAGRAADVVRAAVGDWYPSGDESVDVVIADPARAGLGRPGVAAVARSAPTVLVLVSCDPVSLARDTALLAAAGYRHDGTEVLDLFPHTHHVEAVTRFVPGPGRLGG